MTFHQELSWATRNLVSFRRALADLPELSGVRLACSIHLDLKMVPLLELLLEVGCRVFLTSCNPRTTDPNALEHLRARGAEIAAALSEPPRAYRQALEWNPTHLCELGGGLSLLSPDGHIRASMEGTGSGISALSHTRLLYPVVNWDEVPAKTGIHNRKMVGLTTWMALYHRARITLHGKRVLVIGYGAVGQGLAESARAFGGTPSVAETSPARRLQARFDGWATGALESLLPDTDVVVTATGRSGVLSREHVRLLKPGAILLNAGHGADEIELEGFPRVQVLPHLEALSLGEKTVFLLAEGSMANLTAGLGDSLNAFDVSLAVMASALRYMLTEAASLTPGLHLLPESAWAPFVPGGLA